MLLTDEVRAMRAFVSQQIGEGAIPERELARITGWIATGQQWLGQQSSGSHRAHGSAPRRERTRCDNSLPDPHPGGSSLDADCDRVPLPVQQVRSTGPLRRGIGQRRRPARSPARSPPLSTSSESHGPNSYTSLNTDSANSSAFKSGGIDLRQPRHQGNSAPSHQGKVKGFMQALHIFSDGPAEFCKTGDVRDVLTRPRLRFRSTLPNGRIRALCVPAALAGTRPGDLGPGGEWPVFGSCLMKRPLSHPMDGLNSSLSRGGCFSPLDPPIHTAA